MQCSEQQRCMSCGKKEKASCERRRMEDFWGNYTELHCTIHRAYFNRISIGFIREQMQEKNLDIPPPSDVLHLFQNVVSSLSLHVPWGSLPHQLLPLKKMRKACHLHHRYTSTMRHKMREKSSENHVVQILKYVFGNYSGN